MEKQVITADQAPEAVGPYSQAVRYGSFLYCSGQLPLDPGSGEIKGAGFGEQTKQCMMNLEAILNHAGLSLNHVIKTTIYITDMGKFPEVNSAYGEFFQEPYPARACIEVSALPKGAAVEIEAIAASS